MKESIMACVMIVVEIIFSTILYFEDKHQNYGK